jgi:nucleotide-binding universal stress UspA family protein
MKTRKKEEVPMSASVATTLPLTSFRNILFATDFSAESMHALPYVTALAGKLGSSVHLCHIVPPSPLAVGAPEAAPYLYEAEKKQASEDLDKLARLPELARFLPKVVLASGLIEDELLRAVSENDIDLIVAGTHGRTGLRKLLLGSVVEGMCRVATCPVLTVGPALAPPPHSGQKRPSLGIPTPAAPVTFERILLPTDLSTVSRKILPYVAELAIEFDAAVTILHVLPEEVASNPDAPTLTEPITTTLAHDFEKSLKGCKVERSIVFGETVETILQTARAKNAALIAMGIRHAFMPGVHLHASTAYRIMAGAPCPVLTYR